MTFDQDTTAAPATAPETVALKGEAQQEQQQQQQQQSQKSKAAARDAQRALIANVPTPSRSGRTHAAQGAGEAGGAEKAEKAERGQRQASGLEEVLRRRGIDEAWTALEEMQRQGSTSDKYTVSRLLMKTVGDGRSRLNAPRIYRGIGLVERFIELQPKDVDEVLFNALLDTCCRLKDLARLEGTVRRMRELGVEPSPVTLGILVKTYGQAGDLQRVLQVWKEMDKQRTNANAVTYGCMIDACVKCGNLSKAVEIFTDMKKDGKHRNTILYTTLIKGFGLEKDLPRALALFREMAAENVPYNTITYNSILEACVKCNDLPTAEGVLREMVAPGSPLEPDLITFSTLLKGYCHGGALDKALQVLESIKARGLRCDELVYNTLMDGCVKANDVGAGIGLFEEMVASGLRPSAITHSILARLYQRGGREDAQGAVAQLYQHHGIERPSGEMRRTGSGRDGAGSGRSNARGSWRHEHKSPTASPAGSESAWSAFGFEAIRGEPMTPLSTMPMPAGGSPLLLPMVPPMPVMSREATPCGSPGGCTPATCSPLSSPAGSPFAARVSPTGGFMGGDAFCFGMAPPPMPYAMLQQPMQPQMAVCPQHAGMAPPFPFACGMTGPTGAMGPAMRGEMQIFAVPVMVGTGGEGDMQQQPGQIMGPFPMSAPAQHMATATPQLPHPQQQMQNQQPTPQQLQMQQQMQQQMLQQMMPQQMPQHMLMQPMQALHPVQLLQPMQPSPQQQQQQQPGQPMLQQQQQELQPQQQQAFFENFTGQPFMG